MKLSALLIVKNEEEKLERCLKSLEHIVDEIIIVDTGSTDNTKSIARKYTSFLYDYKWTDDFSAARNYSISKSTGDYNLIIDADEYITVFDKSAIKQFMNSNRHLGVITVQNLIEHNNESFYQPDYITRLIPSGLLFTGSIHEQVNSVLPREIISLEITHDGYYQRKPEKFIRNINLLLNENMKDPQNVYILYQLAIEYHGLNKNDKAKLYYENCYNLIKPENSIYPQLITRYISFCKQLKFFDKALSIIEEHEQYLENYPDFYFECGGFYLDYVLSDIQNNSDYIQLVETCYLACIEIGDISNISSLNGVGSYLAQYNLGVYYETTGKLEKAKKFYLLAKEYDYEPAINRLEQLGN